MDVNAIVPVNTTPAMVSTHAPVLPPMQAIELARALSELAHKSGMSKARTPADAFFVIMYGYELGISPMTALRSIYSVGGAPSCSGEMMLALIRSSGKARKIRLPDSKDITDKAVVYMERADTGEPYEATFTMAQAETAGLVKAGGNWVKYPKAMLLWRAVSICAKALFSDVIAGLYTVEEISPNTPVDETGAPTGDIVIEPPAASTNGNGNGKAWYKSADHIDLISRLIADEFNLDWPLTEIPARLLAGKELAEFETGKEAGLYMRNNALALCLRAFVAPKTVTTASGEPVDTATGEILTPPAEDKPTPGYKAAVKRGTGKSPFAGQPIAKTLEDVPVSKNVDLSRAPE